LLGLECLEYRREYSTGGRRETSRYVKNDWLNRSYMGMCSEKTWAATYRE
jgi:hypothetical protein